MTGAGTRLEYLSSPLNPLLFSLAAVFQPKRQRNKSVIFCAVKIENLLRSECALY